MKAVVQRVRSCSVDVDGERISEIGAGLLIFLGVENDDTENEVAYMVKKIAELRIFPDEEHKMNISLEETGGAAMVVSQFTLCGNCRKGRRPAFDKAAPPETAEKLYEQFAEQMRGRGLEVATGRFAAMMDVTLINDGPVTFVITSR